MTSQRKGSWMQTYSGRKYWPLDPHPKEVFLEDIAHSLAFQCRYNGHTKVFYSVAEHSVLLARYFRNQGQDELAKWAILHDAPEAYLTDIPRPIKKHMPNYNEIEYLNMRAIADRFHLPHVLDAWSGFCETSLMPPYVAIADTQILNNEREKLLLPAQDPDMEWDSDPRPLNLGPLRIEGYRSLVAKSSFIHWVKTLFPEYEE